MVLLPHWEASGEVLELNYKSLFFTVPSDHNVFCAYLPSLNTLSYQLSVVSAIT